jgi:hypothetical protein
MDLPGAEAARSARTLAPGEVLETDVAFVIVGSTPDGSARVVAA